MERGHETGRVATLRAAPPGAAGKVLVIVAHPAIHRSRVNRSLADAIVGMDAVTVHDLYDAYPNFDIDVPREQALLLAHDTLVWQHPFYWYSTPALLKEWQDLVLEFDWAYGPRGGALRGKVFLPVLSTGGPEEAYQGGGYNRFTIRQLLAPVEQTANLCGMRMLPPLVVHGSHRLGEDAIAGHAAAYRRAIEALRDERLDPAALRDAPRLNEHVLAPLSRTSEA